MNDMLSTDNFDIFEGMTSISAVIKAINLNLRDRRIVNLSDIILFNFIMFIWNCFRDSLLIFSFLSYLFILLYYFTVQL